MAIGVYMDKIVSLVKELIEGGYVGQAIIATLLVSGYIYMAIKGSPVPQEYVGLMSAVVAWYFRSAAQTQSSKEERARLTLAAQK